MLLAKSSALLTRFVALSSFFLVLLAPFGLFTTLAMGAPDSDQDGAPRSDGPAGASLVDLVTDLRKEHELVGLAAMVMVERCSGTTVRTRCGTRWSYFIPGKDLVVAVTSNDGDIQAAESAAWKIVNACANQFNTEDDAARRESLPPGE